MEHSYEEGDIVEFPEADVSKLGEFVKHITIGGVNYAEIERNNIKYVVIMDYVKPYIKGMGKDNPNRSFRTRKMTPLTLTKQPVARSKETIECVEEDLWKLDGFIEFMAT